MRPDYGYAEEDQLGKPRDLGLLKRLLPFLRPYRRLLLGSVSLVVALTLDQSDAAVLEQSGYRSVHRSGTDGAG
jgi:hypothetical protein